MSNWFIDHRDKWIIDRVKTAGYINRRDIMEQFGLSRPSASKDLQRVIANHPSLMYYNQRRKRYEKSSPQDAKLYP